MQTRAASLSFKGLLKACDPQGSYEVELQGLWSRVKLDSALKLSNGSVLRVKSRGTWNVEAGPDFKNAKLVIDGRTSRGDVEVHRRASDWLRHGHQLDPAYSKVALHVVEFDDRPSSKGPELPTLVIRKGALHEGLDSRLGRCARHFSSLSLESLRAAFADAGVERLRRKADAAMKDMTERGESFAWLSRLFDAAGFKSNREAFAEILRRYLLHPEAERSAFREAVLRGEAGLLPAPSDARLDDEAREHVEALWASGLSALGRFSPPVEWRRSGLRPLNSPERRLAVVNSIMERRGENPLPALTESLTGEGPLVFNKSLLDELGVSDPFWDWRRSFLAARLKRRAATCGASLALELAVNAVYPCLLARARLKGETLVEELVCESFRLLPRTASNRPFKNALARWFVEPRKAERALSTAAERQGALHLHASYCENVAADCGSCLLFNSI